MDLSHLWTKFNLKPCSVVLNSLSESFIANAISGAVNWHKQPPFTKKKTKKKNTPKRIQTKRKRKVVNNRQQPKHKSSDTSDEDNDDENDEDFVAKCSPIVRKRRKHRRENASDASSSDVYEEFDIAIERDLSVMFNCKRCSFVTNVEENLLLHRAVHKNTCYTCNLKFATAFECEAHMSENHTPVVENIIIYGCRKCKVYFNFESHLKEHFINHLENAELENEKFVCPFCQSLFANKTTLNNHIFSKHFEYKCTFCDLLAPKLETLERHCQTSHSYFGRPFECDFCDFKFAMFGCLQIHRKEYHAVEWFEGESKCRFCNALITDKENILQHLAKHLNVFLYKCFLCEFCTNSRQKMEEHSRIEHMMHDWFARTMEMQLFNEKVREMIRERFTQQTEITKPARPKPSALETQEAIATILESNEEILNEITETPAEIIETIEPKKASPEIYMKTRSRSSITTLTKLNTTEKKRGKKKKENKEENKVNQINGGDDTTECEGTAGEETEIYDSDFENEKGNKELSNDCNSLRPKNTLDGKVKAVMTIDPVTGRLYVNGIPVVDECGKDVYVVNQSV